MDEIFVLTFEQPTAVNVEALDEATKAISPIVDGFVADGKEIRFNLFAKPDIEVIRALREAVEKHDASVLSIHQQKEILQKAQLSELNQKYQTAVDPAKADLVEIAERLRRLELVLGLAGQIASGIEASAGDSGLVG